MTLDVIQKITIFIQKVYFMQILQNTLRLLTPIQILLLIKLFVYQKKKFLKYLLYYNELKILRKLSYLKNKIDQEILNIDEAI